MGVFELIRREGRLAFEFVRGSRLYNLDTPASDLDAGGVLLCSRDEFYGVPGYQRLVSDARHDNAWFEIGELMRLLLKPNPTLLETLFIPR